jgi:hypothetical protein
MSRRGKAGWVVSGVVEAPVDKVWQALLAVHSRLNPALRSEIDRARSNAPYKTIVGTPGAGKVTIEVDKKEHSIAIEGEWWYRGVHSVEPHERGSLVFYSVYNIAPGLGHWAAQLVQGPQHAREMEDELTRFLKAIGARLGCAVEVI